MFILFLKKGAALMNLHIIGAPLRESVIQVMPLRVNGIAMNSGTFFAPFDVCIIIAPLFSSRCKPQHDLY